MLIMRGLPTLALRMERHSRNALETDRYFDAAPYLDATQKACIREWMGDGIVRASVGLERADDLIADLHRALRARTFKGAIGPLACKLIT
jgi:cystathionine beta-lyase/cystathionine gamma-synthase